MRAGFRRGGCEPASLTNLKDALAWSELQRDPRIETIAPIGHACMALPGVGSARLAGRVDLGGRPSSFRASVSSAWSQGRTDGRFRMRDEQRYDVPAQVAG
jgi:hypothetical protein